MQKRDDLDGQIIVPAFVKWYSAADGYGFVVSDQCDGDILLHADILQSFGRDSIAHKTSLRVLIEPSEQGLKVMEILRIEDQANLQPPEGKGPLPARVK